MPIMQQYQLSEHDVTQNNTIYYAFIENEKKKGGDYISTMLRSVPNGLPMTLKRSGGSGIDSYYDDDVYVPIVYALNRDLDFVVRVLLHKAIVIIPSSTFNSNHWNQDFFGRKCPKFFKYFNGRFNDMLKQYTPKRLPDWL